MPFNQQQQFGQQAPMSPEQFAAIVQAQQQVSNDPARNVPAMAQPSFPQMRQQPTPFNFTEFARKNGIDTSQFPGGEEAMAGALLKAAQGYMQNRGRVSEMEQRLEAARQSAAQHNQQPTPANGTAATGPNVDQWLHLLVEKNGKIFPADGASVPWDVVQAAQQQFEQRRTNIESIMKDPMAVIREHAGGDWLREQVEAQFKELHARQQREAEIDTWFDKHRNILYETDANGNQIAKPPVERLSQIADEYRKSGTKPEYIFQYATRDLEREMMQAEVEHIAQQQFERQQARFQQQFQQPQFQPQFQQPQNDHEYMQQALQQASNQMPGPQHPSQAGSAPDRFWQQTDWNNPQSQPQTQMTVPRSPQAQTFLDRNVGAPSGVHPGAMQTTSRDSAPGSAADLQSADFVADDPETIAREAATESGFMNGV
jgi:hypothetical protein